MREFRGCLTVPVVLALLAIPGATRAQEEVWVDASHSPCPGTGTQADPYCAIQDAICRLRSGSGGTVHVLPGTYNEAIRMFPGIDVISTDGPLTTTIDPSSPTVKACYRSDCTVGTVTPCSAVYFGGGANGRLEGFRITNGRGINQTCAGGCNVQIGGGITVFNSSPTITQNQIVTNTITPADVRTISFYGGGIYIQGDDRNMVARPVITENLIEGNLADPPAGKPNSPSRGYGGGIYAGFYTAPIIRGNTIRSNTVGSVNTSNQQAGGAGIAFYSGMQGPAGVLDSNRVEDNLASDFGGGILIGEFLEGGQSVESPSLGTLENNVIVGNDAFDGGGVQANTTGVVLRNNTVVDNIASSGSTNGARGGGIEIWTTHRPEYQINLVNNILAFNTAEAGTGGASGQGGGLYVDGGSNPTVRFEDLYGNTPNNVGGAKTDGDYIGSNGNVSVDPLFVDRPNRDYRLATASTLIEGGDNAQTPGSDFDGTPRPQDANEDGMSVVDFGAFEFPADFDRDGLPDWQDPDDDNDGTIDVSDCAPRNRAVTGTPGVVDATMRIDKVGGATLRWMRSFQGHTYNVYRGTLQAPWVYNETCWKTEAPEPSATDGEAPLPGQGFYYLVAARNTCGESTYAGGGLPGSSCTPADRDTDVDLRLDPGDNCPVVSNNLQGDADADFVGDACDLCPSTFDPGQGDQDADLRGNACDNCPTVANADQLDGDADLVGDLCDNCVSVSNPAQIDTDVDGMGDACDLDDDNDGVDDTLDNCPLTPNLGQTDTDLDGLGNACDPDDDNDGVDDTLDNCPLVLNAAQEDVDLDGFGDACDNCAFVSNADQADIDADTVGDACDNCPSSANADQADFDTDGAGDACDLDDDNDGTEDALDCAPLDPSASAPPTVVADARVEKGVFTTLNWQDQGTGFVYDVAGGDLLAMRGEGGVDSAACLNDDGPTATWSDERADPTAGAGYYYLIRSQNACGGGSYGDDSGGNPRGPLAACP